MVVVVVVVVAVDDCGRCKWMVAVVAAVAAVAVVVVVAALVEEVSDRAPMATAPMVLRSMARFSAMFHSGSSSSINRSPTRLLHTLSPQAIHKALMPPESFTKSQSDTRHLSAPLISMGEWMSAD